MENVVLWGKSKLVGKRPHCTLLFSTKSHTNHKMILGNAYDLLCKCFMLKERFLNSILGLVSGTTRGQDAYPHPSAAWLAGGVGAAPPSGRQELV